MLFAIIGFVVTLSLTLFGVWFTIRALEEALRGPEPKVAWPMFVVVWLITLSFAALTFWQPLHWQGRA